ncbi:substrate-binding domain-containing protein [Photobacterium makurazakiensis]|uniref:substrate-binding domain-containing protein n=1 Tax=Photobacterium makurazakiensis TaxID=2910234 RepID=UPI003D1122C6
MNIKDVASLAKVSPATVSRYINQSDSIAPDTAARIAKVLKISGYEANKHLPRSGLKSNPTIGIMIPSLKNPVFADIVAAIQLRARHFGYSTLILDTQYDTTLEYQCIATFIRHRVAGVILTTSEAQNNSALDLLKEFEFPYCLLHSMPSRNEPSVFIDNYQAGVDVANALFHIGHRRFGMVTGLFSSSDRAQARFAGFNDALNTLKCPLTHLLEVDQSQLEPFELHHDTQSQKLLPPTAWFCSNDLLALKTIKALNNQGLLVPEDVSVVGFDGMDIGKMMTPPLASVRVPHQQMGKCAVDILFNNQRSTVLPHQIKLPYKLTLMGTVQSQQPE